MRFDLMASNKIVVLDGYTLNPGDISWSPIEALGELTVYDRSGESAGERAHGAEIVLTNKNVMDAQLINSLPKLRYIGVLATGTNVVDLEAARQRGITVTNVPGYGAPAVAQHVFALLLQLVDHTAEHIQAVRDGRWKACPDFSFTVEPRMELEGKTLGILGVGAIGSRVARIGSAFGMKIAAADVHRTNPARRRYRMDGGQRLISGCGCPYAALSADSRDRKGRQR